MKNKKHYLVFSLIALIISASSFIYAQTTDEKTKQEHQAVQDFFNQYRQKHPPQHDPNFKRPAEEEKYKSLSVTSLKKSNAYSDRKSFLMNGNKVKVSIWNYGGIGDGYHGATIREVGDLVWHNSPYIFQFTPLVGASVPDSRNPGKRIHILSDGLDDYSIYNLNDVSPLGDTLYQFEPLPGFADPNQSYLASNPCADLNRDGKPDSWPSDWYNPTLGKYVWPGYLTQGTNNADLECYWRMDDRDNAEFPYYPFNGDPKRRGIGIQIDGRAFQWSNSLAENAVFVVYTITNVSDKDLDSVFFGVYGDPDLGNAADNKDDLGYFVPPYSTPDVNVDKIPQYARSMVYFYDYDGIGAQSIPLGYLGCKFLESPGNPNDGIDNDGDKLIDERQDDGIDNDKDWNAATDDVGVDGIPNTGDEGEGDSKPTAGKKLPDGSLDPLHPGEPNFELTDLDEVDQIGLTSFDSWIWNNGGAVNQDENMWQRSVPGSFNPIPNKNDIVFIYGSGYISLKKGETKRISMSLLFGKDLNDLLTSAATVQNIYNKNYNFFKPPATPNVTAVPGDKKVTLYWDNSAEQSTDPITGDDFEGYVIYRSTDPTFTDIQKVSDGKGAGFLNTPLQDLQGYDAKWDKINTWKGYHPVAYQGRGIHYYLGDNSGLVHSFVDSNKVINGQTYYYAVVAYDHGDSLGIPPSENTKKILVDPVTGELRFDPNTVAVVPGPRASGYVPPSISATNILHPAGAGNGLINFNILNDLLVKDNNYTLTFNDTLYSGTTKSLKKNYSIVSNNPITESFTLFDNKFTELTNKNILNDSNLKIADASGKVYKAGTDYEINYSRGAVKRSDNSTMPDNSNFIITYRYNPVFQSTSLSGTDENTVFDGINLKVVDYVDVDIDTSRSHFNRKNTNLGLSFRKYTQGRTMKYPADYEITFYSTNKDTVFTIDKGQLVKIPVNFSVKNITNGVAEPVKSLLMEQAITKDLVWGPQEELVLFKPGSKGTFLDTLTWGITLLAPSDTGQKPILPTDGDLLGLFTKRPFNSKDVFVLKTDPGKLSAEKASTSLDQIRVVPNPYVGFNELEPANKLPNKNRGERRIYFDNLPAQCTIRIYTLSGDPVQTIDHNSTAENGREFWNLLNRDGFSIAYGLYIAHVDAPGVGEKILKFAIIK